MAKNRNPKLNANNRNVFSALADEIRLVIRLMMDGRVNPLLKLLPIATVVYFFIPDLILGPIDDALVMGVGTYLFIELCPPYIVEEHRAALRDINTPGDNIPKQQTRKDEIPIYEDEIIEGEFRDEE